MIRSFSFAHERSKMNSDIIASLTKPPIYTKSTAEFWNDEYISKQMLKAHLDPDFDGASRKFDFIDKSVAWITSLIPPADYPKLLDVGCGPGIYAEKFARTGYQVTGVDFSKRSIDHARQSAFNKKLNISYLYQNYLEMDLNKSFDFCTMIYCDYGALSTKERQIIMGKIYHHLKPGGKLLLDVFSMTKFYNFQEQQTWEICPNGGFWRADEHMVLSGFYKYTDNVTLDLISIVTEEKITPYYLWNTYFSKETLIQEAEDISFKVCGLFGDAAGGAYRTDSDTIAILLEK